jgi:hypothetical protein
LFDAAGKKNDDIGGLRPSLQEAMSVMRSDSAKSLLVDQQMGFTDEPLPLGLAIRNPAGDETVTLTGLAAGTIVAPGAMLETSGWQMPGQALAAALAYPPRDFVGVMEATVRLLDVRPAVVETRVGCGRGIRRRAGDVGNQEYRRSGARPCPATAVAGGSRPAAAVAGGGRPAVAEDPGGQEGCGRQGASTCVGAAQRRGRKARGTRRVELAHRRLVLGTRQGEILKRVPFRLIRRHARACRGHPRLSSDRKDVDGRDKPGHDAPLIPAERKTQ